MSPGSSALAGLVARLTDPHDRETYAGLLSYFDSLPADDEMFRLARLLGLLTLVGQRIPEAAATLTAELQAQAKAASAYYELFNDRLTRLAAEITEGVDTSTIARAMAESVRQAAGKELEDVRRLAEDVAKDFRHLSRTVRAATAETGAERAKLAQVMLDLNVAAAVIEKRGQRQKAIIGWLIVLLGLMSGILILTFSVRFN
jgi:hypothetical protein